MPTCEYLRRGPDGKNRECGQPAKYRGVRGPRLHYCQAHGDYIFREIEIATLDGVSLGKPIKWNRR